MCTSFVLKLAGLCANFSSIFGLPLERLAQRINFDNWRRVKYLYFYLQPNFISELIHLQIFIWQKAQRIVTMENYPTSNNTNYGEKLTLETLPNEVLYLILNRLLPTDLVSCYNTCEKLRKVLSNMTLLQNKCKFFVTIQFKINKKF